MSNKQPRKRNRGWFQRGADPRRSSYRPTKEECQRGYAKALETCTERGWECLAWFYRRMRNHLQEKRHGPQEEG